MGDLRRRRPTNQSSKVPFSLRLPGRSVTGPSPLCEQALSYRHFEMRGDRREVGPAMFDHPASSARADRFFPVIVWRWEKLKAPPSVTKSTCVPIGSERALLCVQPAISAAVTTPAASGRFCVLSTNKMSELPSCRTKSRHCCAVDTNEASPIRTGPSRTTAPGQVPLARRVVNPDHREPRAAVGQQVDHRIADRRHGSCSAIPEALGASV